MSISPLVLAEVPGVSKSCRDFLPGDPGPAFCVITVGAFELAKPTSFPLSPLSLRPRPLATADSRSS